METKQPKFTVSKHVSMVDETIKISVQHLRAFQQITVIARILENKADFISHAHFIADNSGDVNLSTCASLGGTYVGTEAMGIIWSMVVSSVARKGSRLSKSLASTPYKVQLAVVDGFQTILCWSDARDIVCKEQLDRWYLASDTRQITIKHGRIRGTLFTPKQGNKHPGIIDLFGSAGGLIELRAALLASYGYTTLALAYFAFDDLAEQGIEFDFDYFDEAINFLSSYPLVDITHGLGIIGVSKGAEIAVHMASTNPNITTCVAINTAAYHMYGIHTHKGKDIEVYNPDFWEVPVTPEGRTPRGMDQNTENIGLIPMGNPKCHFLVLQSGDDEFRDMSTAAHLAKRIYKSGNKNCILKILPGAGHLLEPPITPLCRSVYHKLAGELVCYGGERRLHAEAQQQSWNTVLEFFAAHFNVKYTRTGRLPMCSL